jgi:hypothetical protein
MKKVIFAGVVLVAALVALRRFGPALGERAMKKCEEMFERLPDDSTPKRMLRGIDEIREQNTRILHDLDQRDEGPILATAD